MKSVGKFLKSQAILCLLALFIVFLAISRPSFVSPTNIKKRSDGCIHLRCRRNGHDYCNHHRRV